eukprot:6468392-Pyramimonas_sp.AAC.1
MSNKNASAPSLAERAVAVYESHRLGASLVIALAQLERFGPVPLVGSATRIPNLPHNLKDALSQSWTRDLNSLPSLERVFVSWFASRFSSSSPHRHEPHLAGGG